MVNIYVSVVGKNYMIGLHFLLILNFLKSQIERDATKLQLFLDKQN